MKSDASIVITPGKLTFPTSSKELFGRDAPLTAEIGVGSGQFIEMLSRTHPEWNVLGIDRAPDSVVRTFRRLLRAGSENARVMKADAEFVLRDVVPQRGLHAVYVNFPDPWPRRKHRHRRLLQPPLLELLSTRIEDGGSLFLTSDHREFFDSICSNAGDSGLFRIEERDPPPETLETKYARKWRNREMEIFHAVLTKTSAPDEHACYGEQSAVTIQIDNGMHHAVLKGELPDLTGFEKLVFSFSRGTVVVLDAYRAINASGYAFLVHVEEHGLSQEIIIEAREGKNGYVVGVKRFGEPLQTRGLRHAVRSLTEWLEGFGMTVVHRKY